MNQAFCISSKKIRIQIVLGIFLFLNSGPAFSEENLSVPRGQEKEWLILTFINGHNNLDSYGSLDINEMETVGSTDQMHAVVQWASLGSNTKRLYVQKDEDKAVVSSPVVEDLGRKVDMGDPNELVAFATWGAQTFPAKKIFLNVWNHGNGWKLTPLELKPLDISYDDLSGNAISTQQLGVALRTISNNLGRPIDIYGSDACLMAMTELASEMKDSVQVMVGSQDLEPGDGWPYGEFFAKWNSNPGASAFEIGKFLTDSYVESYSNGSQGRADVTFSVMNLKVQPNVELAAKDLTSQILVLPENERALLLQRWLQTDFYFYGDYRDYGQLVDRAVELNFNSSFVNAAQNLKIALGELVSYNRASGNRSRATGVSIWLPSRKRDFDLLKDRYSPLQWSQSSQWFDSLAFLLK